MNEISNEQTDAGDEETIDAVTKAVNESLPEAEAQPGSLPLLEAEELLSLTIAELQAYAGARGIDLGGAKRKGDIVDAILGGVDLSHFGPVVDELLDRAGIPIDRVISRHFQVGKTSLAVGWFDPHGTPVGRFLGITPNQGDQIRQELQAFAERGADTLAAAVRETNR